MRNLYWAGIALSLCILTFLNLDDLAPNTTRVTLISHPLYQIASESGQVRSGLFEPSGNSEVISIGRWVTRGGNPVSRCGKKPFYAIALQFLTLGTTQAVDCGAGTPCGGSYMAPGLSIYCGDECGGSWYNRYFSNPAAAEYWNGYRTGGGTCPEVDGSGDCVCMDIGCTN